MLGFFGDALSLSAASGQARAAVCRRCTTNIPSAGALGLCAECERSARLRAASIMYHDVVEGGRADASGFPGEGAAIYKLDLDDFRNHLKAIEQRVDRNAVTTCEHHDYAANSETPVFLTFDDGGSSAFSPIAPALEEHGWRGHFFITTDRIGQPGFLDVRQIRDLRRRGHVIGSHSCSHPTRMAHCSAAELEREWGQSVKVLSDILGEAVSTASVPGGFYSRKVAEMAARAGIRTLFTSEPTLKARVVHGCLVLGRYFVQCGMAPNTSAAFAGGGFKHRVKQAALWKCKKVAKAAGGSAYLQVREFLLALTPSLK